MATLSRWYPDSVTLQQGKESYRLSRGRNPNPYDLCTEDAVVIAYARTSRNSAAVTVALTNIHPKFRGLTKGVESEFLLRSSVTQLGVNADKVKIHIDREARACTVDCDLVALSPLAVLMLDFITEGALIGKLFAREANRLVRNADYLTRLLDDSAVNQKGQRLLVYGTHDKPDWDLKLVDGRVVAFLPVLPGSFTYNGEVHGLLPTIGVALRTGTSYKNLIRLHQEFREGHTRVGTPASPLMVRSYAMHFRTLFGRVVDELLPEGLSSMSSRVIEPHEGGNNSRDRTFVLYGSSTKELTHIPIEFYTLESYREQVPFSLRKTLSQRCSSPGSILKLFQSSPKGSLPCAAYICKGGQFSEMTPNDWITTDPHKVQYVGMEDPEQQQDQVQRYAYQQCEYAILSAMTQDDISSDGVLVTRYFPSPVLKSLVLSRSVTNRLKAIYFARASRSCGQFLSQEDSAMLYDLITFGIAVFQVNEAKGEVFQYICRPGRDVGQFVPLDRRQDYLKATFFGVYGSNLVAGDFEAELMQLLNGVLQFKKTCEHPLLNPSKPLALVTGGGPGAMEVGNRVAKSLGILSCGLVVDFGSVASNPGATINEQRQNPYVEAYFTYRADKLVERQSDFNLDFPIFLTGGIGTDFEYALEEVRRKVGTVAAHPVILFGTPEHWGEKLSGRYAANLAAGTIKGSEWICTVPWVVGTGAEALEVYRHFFAGLLPCGPGHPLNTRGFMVASEHFGTGKK